PSNIKQEWRTPPLWGVASSAPYLHDGRAATLEEAIALHDGEAAASRIGYQRLNPDGKRAVIGLLQALVAPPNVPAVPKTPNRKDRAGFGPPAALGR
ncbi:MAG: di-heme oxidoredictase family protein, partial [Pirellulales bacterium]